MKTKALVNAAIMLAIYLLFFVFYNIGFFPTLMSIALPIPLIVYSATVDKTSEVIWLLIGCFIGSFLFGSVYGIMTTLNYGVMGAILGIGLIKKWPYWQRLLNASLVSVVALPITIYVLTGLNIQESMLQMVEEMNIVLDSMSAILPSMDAELNTQFIDRFTSLITTLLPTFLILVGLASAFLSDTVGGVILKRMKYSVPSRGNVQNFQLGAKLAGGLLISQILSLFINNAIINMILMNISMLLSTLFLLQGIVVILTYFKARQRKMLGIIIVLFALMSGFVVFLAWLGIADAFFDYRERFVVKKL